MISIKQMNSISRMYEECYPTAHSKRRLADAFERWYDAEMLRLGEGVRPIMGAATPLTSLRTRWDREQVLATIGESHEVDFNIAFGQAIEISAVYCRLQVGAVTAVRQHMRVLVDLDGPALANDSISTAALFAAREILESCIANFGFGNDALTSGAAVTDTLQQYDYKEPILTARNPGVAYISLTSSGEGLVGIQYKLVEVTRDEQLLLFALGRA